jgi:prepilin-type processing-associated H-X9-DG protein
MMPRYRSFFFDGIIGAAQPLGSDVIPPKEDVDGAGSPEYQMGSLAFRRHGSVTNVAFWDGHVAPVKLPDLWTLRWTKNWKPRGPYPVPAGFQGTAGPVMN